MVTSAPLTQTLTPRPKNVQPSPHEQVRLEDLSPASIEALGERILRLAEDPAEHGAFVARGHHLLEQGHSTEDITAAYLRALATHAAHIGGVVRRGEALTVDTPNGPDLAWPHVDRSKVLHDGTGLNSVFGNTTEAGVTEVITAKETAMTHTSGEPILGMKAAIANRTDKGLPAAGLTEVDPSSLALSVLNQGDAIFMRTGGVLPSGDTAIGTAHAFDIAPGADDRTTRPFSVRPSN